MSSQVKLKGKLQVPGDKSITHRALIFSALSRGKSTITGMSPALDCASSLNCLSTLGLTVHHNGSQEVTVECQGITNREAVLDAGNSGTTIRLLSGLIAGHRITATLDGDESLRSRPMSRVLKHLQAMGAEVAYLSRADRPPFRLSGTRLNGISIELDVASAQVQTAILLAGLHAQGETRVKLPAEVRDHTTRMFSHIGVPFSCPDPLTVQVSRIDSIAPYRVDVPADTSSAAFFLVAAACLPGSDLTLTNVCLNPGRDLIVDVLREMGAQLEIIDSRICAGEPVGDIRIQGQDRLRGATIGGDRIARGIDEIPILALAGAFCDGQLTIKDAQELRVKESDRIAAIAANMTAAGAQLTETSDGFVITGQAGLAGGAAWRSYGDHRMAMTGIIASLLCKQAVQIDDEDCISVSYPNFKSDLAGLYSLF